MRIDAQSGRTGWLACAALLTTAAFGDPVIAPALTDISPVDVGEAAPSFTAYRVDGSEFRFEPGSLARPTLIVFYRGGWCGACNQQLRDVATVHADIRDMGVDVLFPNGDRPEILYSSLGPETKAAIDGLGYLLLSDAGLNAAAAFGVAYVLEDDVLSRYRAREHWDLADSSIDRFDALPLPSIFLVGTDGVIAFRYYDPDPRVRLPATELKAIVADIVGSKN
jgi:peroxiredoxin